MKKLPIGIQTFSKLIQDDYLYIDKTHEILNLIENGEVFLSKPRRFGKSLLKSLPCCFPLLIKTSFSHTLSA